MLKKLVNFEALNLAFAYYKRKRDNFIAADDLHPQVSVLKPALKYGVNMIVNDLCSKEYFNELSSFGEDKIMRCVNIMFAYPNTYGDIFIPENHIKFAKDNNILTTGIDMTLTKLTSQVNKDKDGQNQGKGIPMKMELHQLFLLLQKNY